MFLIEMAKGSPETERLYPHRKLVAGEAYFALAV